MAYAPRPRIGASGIKIFVLDETTDTVGGTPSYGVGYSIPGTLDISFDPGGNSTSLAADDGIAFIATNIGDMKLSIGWADMDPATKAIILGQSYANGAVQEKTTDQSPYIAIMGKRLRTGTSGGSLVYDYFCLPKVKLIVPKEDAKTKGATIEFQPYMFEGVATKLVANDTYRVITRTDDANATSTFLTNFFNAPVISNSADLGAITVAVAKSTTKATFVFTKSGGGIITLTQANLTTATLPTFKGTTAVPIAGAYVITNNGTATVTVTFTPTVAYGAVAVSGSVCSNAVYDQNCVYASQAGSVWTSD
jgi:phi13 family phage major tail protein